MAKKQDENDPFQIGLDAIGHFTPQNRLNIRELRRRTDELRTYLSNHALPDWSDMPYWHRFAIVVRLLPSDQRERLLGRSDKQLSRYEAGEGMPFPVAAALAVETEIPLDWIATGKPPETRAATLMSGDEVLVPKLSWRPSAGPGKLVLEGAERIPFPRVLLESIGVKPENARILESSGESMTPTIGDGDIMVVDISNKQIVEGKVYAFSIGDEVFVKRLRRLGDKVFMFSDNRELFPEEEAVPADQPFIIFGRVKWTGRRL